MSNNMKTISVQTAVEQPFIYLFARCPPTDEQINYTQTRVDGLKELQHNLETEKGDVTDFMRFFHGDPPPPPTPLHVALK